MHMGLAAAGRTTTLSTRSDRVGLRVVPSWLALLLLQCACQCHVSIARAAAAGASTPPDDWALHAHTAADLHRQYENVFPHSNRNAASHLWASFLLDRAAQLTPDQLELFFASFCPISGSPVEPRDATRHKVPLRAVDGTPRAGLSYHCCAPCQCDMMDLTRVDTRAVKTASGVRTYDFIVIGDPCTHPSFLNEPWKNFGEETTLATSAPELYCKAGRLGGAYKSDHGYVIIGMLIPLKSTTAKAQDSSSPEIKKYCNARASTGFASGMGQIFRRVAGVAPIPDVSVGTTQPPAPPAPLVAPDTTAPQAPAAGTGPASEAAIKSAEPVGASIPEHEKHASLVINKGLQLNQLQGAQGGRGVGPFVALGGVLGVLAVLVLNTRQPPAHKPGVAMQSVER